MSNEIQVKSVAEFVSQISLLPSGAEYVFRGQAQNWKLLPRIARESPAIDWKFREQHVFNEFKRRAAPMLGLVGISSLELLGIAQHNGVPTRLLDWSWSALSALWFAVREPWQVDWKSDSAIYAFHLEEDDIQNQDDALWSEPFGSRGTKFFLPRHVNVRITAQEGLFSVHPFSNASKRFVELERNKKYKDRFFRFDVPRQRREEIKLQLRTLGVHAATVFPDLVGIAEFLTDKFNFKQQIINLSAAASAGVSAVADLQIRKKG